MGRIGSLRPYSPPPRVRFTGQNRALSCPWFDEFVDRVLKSGIERSYALRRLLIALALFLPTIAATSDPLAGHVTIYRDNYGVPHIVGDTEPAAFFGYGYAQAQDHLEEMMIQYRDAQGRRAEAQGINALGRPSFTAVARRSGSGSRPKRFWPTLSRPGATRSD